ncbi:fungal-specific transcription factor domain-domain-containing protein [Microdochium bolleyi]|uniref:Fungal-specific transcription factor domain-domain-containing protein n=1 Tax=Microdochium bolleyi TaxID=196109 RepID=A0A136JG26_9PEZI|nr:fungal-specific transcription factor domain-domain-containing protein [Microdochium bolleyi]
MSGFEAGPSSPDVAETGTGASPHLPAPEHPAVPRKSKRDRVALACQRCKTRKQKCDGQRPACASCARLSLKCVYIVPLVPAAGEKKLYIKALEQRIAELESYLASVGHMNVGTDHLRRLSQAATTASTSPPQHSFAPSQSDQTIQQAGDDDGDDILRAVRDLSLQASGHYVGASSHITIGRVLSSVVNSERPPFAVLNDEHLPHGADDPAPKSVYSNQHGEMIGVPFLTDAVATRLIHGWFRHIATRYPCVHSARVMELHANREGLTDEYDKTILHLIYAVSGRWLESAGEMGHFFSDHHYDLAFDEMDAILQLRDSRTVDYLLLMALYCTRAPRDPGAWTYVGAAMRVCIELGLHRKPRKQPHSLASEMNKRRFWTTYFLDRDISIAIGRPPSISDHDIDAELPLDIPENTVDDAFIRNAALNVSASPVNPPNTMTSWVHRTRLKRIESEIQHIVYRVDFTGKVPDATLNDFLDRLNHWRDTIPYEAQNYMHTHDTAFEGIELYTIHYHRCVRFLLYPQLAENPVNMHYLKLCANACAGIISDYRRVHQVFPVGFSALSIQSVFMAGLTMLYCAWLAPINYLNVDGPLTDCQLLLYIVTERYPSARKYRDVFERIKTTILTLIAQGKHEPRNPVTLDTHMQTEFPTMANGQWGSGMNADLTFMINTMTGNTAAATPPFDMGLDPTASALMGHGLEQSDEMAYHWAGVPPNLGNGIDPMTGTFHR